MSRSIVVKAAASVTASDDDRNGAFDIILSAQTRDRDGDVLKSSEWKQPLPQQIPINVDHAMTTSKIVGSGKPFINADGDLQVRGTFASTPLGQETRTLVTEGHLSTVSVEFLEAAGLKSGRHQRELIGGSFVYTPSNREARVMSAKALDTDPPESPDELIESVGAIAEQLRSADDEDRPALVDQLAQTVAALATALRPDDVDGSDSDTADDAAVKSLQAEIDTSLLQVEIAALLAEID